MFQSPHEDSFSSDRVERVEQTDAGLEGFNPLTRIRSLLTYAREETLKRYKRIVSIPSRGFVLF